MTESIPISQSIITFRNSQGQESRGTLLKLTRHKVVMEVYNPYSIVQLSEVLANLKIVRGESTIYNGRAVVASLVNTGLMLVVSATLVDVLEDLRELQDEPEELAKETDQYIAQWEARHQLREEYMLAVAGLRAFLADLHLWLEQFDVATDDERESTPLPRESFDAVAERVINKSNELFAQFEQAAQLVDDEELNTHKSFAQRDLHPLLMRSPFFYRSYVKPLGYAGDYGMVNMMLADGRNGPTTYTQLINSYFHQIGPTRAHRNRIAILQDRLTDLGTQFKAQGQRAQILNMACGPALEVQRFVRTRDVCEHCDFTLVDFNQETLEHAEEKIGEAREASGYDASIHFVQKSVHQLLKEAAKPTPEQLQQENKYDVIYCAGLFDYLSDKICARLLRLFYRWVKPGGYVLVTNVHPKNPSQLCMEHIVEWYMEYRDETDMLKLVKGYGDHYVYLDLTGLNVFLEVHKPREQA
ncbi:class I SAM-dependent methyltransferase [Gilvimarinus sp. F26214L]|uniref:class I SAM-dependent methyltransferase n=1 Tax=Gilvimarinus sp. DZF01 TaxID=3461371 RepID=UPI004045DDC8